MHSKDTFQKKIVLNSWNKYRLLASLAKLTGKNFQINFSQFVKRPSL